jgi:signal peptidase II
VSDTSEKPNEIKDSIIRKILYFALTAVILIADQISKLIVITLLPIGKPVQVIGDFLIFQHVRNQNGLFSLGADFPAIAKQLLFLWVPVLVIGFIVYLILASKEVNRGQRWILAAICGGGLGNVFDRFFRPDGVVDFVSVRVFGIFGFERWPTFNLADSTIVVCLILLLVSIIITEIKIRKQGVKRSSHE